MRKATQSQKVSTHFAFEVLGYDFLHSFNMFLSSADAIYSIASTESVVTKSIAIQSFTLEYIETVTQKYKTQIGEGGFGAVYRGTLPDGQEVAVKVRSATSTQGTREFDNEVCPVPSCLKKTIHLII